ncbi:hypothetical protein BDV26DRAFT_76446 [Aspergillus bertholletiae]|uniref:Uncharacterized protein n=1 Tax=Aspergillus bertholletiae TaxID=1226010 RepID=A0A5N7AUT2_9EURO|nr:hypothetical protein BDV26DRAFT_76446 [Aspergillus bertholletiae]
MREESARERGDEKKPEVRMEVRSREGKSFFFLSSPPCVYSLYIGPSLFVSVHGLVGVNKMHDEVFAGLSGCPLCSTFETISSRVIDSSGPSGISIANQTFISAYSTL